MLPPAPSRGLSVHTAVPTAPVSGINVPALHNPTTINGPAVHTPTTVNGPAAHSLATVNAITTPNKIAGTPPQYHPNASPQTNPVYDRPAWSWNNGAVWMPQGKYWGGAFWGPFSPGEAMTAKIMGSIIRGNHIYQSYGVSPRSPGATLLSNYGLRQVECGTPGLVVIYGPSFGVVCAYPTYRVGAGNYTVNINTLTITERS